jgi:Flp pilus assembly protein TadG
MATVRRRTSHHRQRGQVVPIIALFSVVLVGAAALAVDLSLNTHSRRAVQNATDAAALAGAQDLPASVQQADRQKAVFAAVVTLYRQLDQPVPVGSDVMSDITTGNGNDCNPGVNHCHVQLAFDSYTATIDTPPVSSTTVAYRTDSYLEVNLDHTNTNNFGKEVGHADSTEHGHSVAYHFAANQAYGAALFANTYVASGNDGELVEGNVYAQRYINPQSAGHAGFCASMGGRVVLGAPQAPASYDTRANPGQADILPATANMIRSLPNCNPLNIAGQVNTTESGTVNQTPTSPTDCSNPIPGVQVTATYQDAVGACVADPPLPPPVTNFQQPTMPSSDSPLCDTAPPGPGMWWYQCDNRNGPALTVTSPLPPGTYVIAHGSNNNCGPPNCYDIDFSRVTMSLRGVTIVLYGGATMGVENQSDVTIDPTREPDGSTCPQSVPTDCRYSIYSGAGSPSQVFVTGNNSTLTLYGTLYLVAGTMNCASNAFLQIAQGQAIVNTWNVQSGNHDNPIISFDGGMVAPQTEILRLAE